MDKHTLSTCLTFCLLATAAILGSQVLAMAGILAAGAAVVTEN